jgi:hypothetical protein
MDRLGRGGGRRPAVITPQPVEEGAGKGLDPFVMLLIRLFVPERVWRAFADPLYVMAHLRKMQDL